MECLKEEYPYCEALVSVYGGGLCVKGNAGVTLAGRSIVHTNVVINGSGGGLYVEEASVTITGGSSVQRNAAPITQEEGFI